MDLLKGLQCAFDGEKLLITSIDSSDADMCSLNLYCERCQTRLFLSRVTYDEVRKIFELEPKYFSSELMNRIKRIQGEK